jgi:hypothetical protein
LNTVLDIILEAIMTTPHMHNGDPQFYSVSYAGSPSTQQQLATSWTKFAQPDPATLKSYEVWARITSQTGVQVMADYRMPPSAPDGLYRIEVFIPSQKATVRDAQYSVANNFRTENGMDVFDEAQVVINQGYYNDHWVRLGWFSLAPSTYPQSGRVRLTNYSKNAKSWISFSPLRWIHIRKMSCSAV